ncbi:maleylacetoacetate isomerase [Algihabitans albus]|uniref:maleylacetoacetate isomerase n=1 Tax=Algihabitans albus TaxID=2164067 RepID=UPI001ABC6462|nr:maleylacetoacetate isomerase [Algihabitans albus]
MGYVLHNFFRSSTSFRVRATLNLKGLDYAYLPYALRKGEQRDSRHLALNPQGLVPTLETPQGPLAQSLAIIEWLEETNPEPPLLPSDPWARARVRSLAQAVALDIHPINNLRVLRYLSEVLGADEEAVAVWFRHWVSETFAPLEQRLSQEPETGQFCHGESPSLADICLAGQVLSNRRFSVSIADYPTIQRIFDACMALPAFEAAAPNNQPDAE